MSDMLSYIWLVRRFSLSLPQMIEYMKKLLCIIALALDVMIRLAGIETNLKTNAFMRLVVLSPNLFTSKSLDNGLVEVTSMTSWHVGGDAMDQSPWHISLSDNDAARRLRFTPLLSSSKFPAFSASKCLQNSSIIQNNSVTFVIGSYIKYICNLL